MLNALPSNYIDINISTIQTEFPVGRGFRNLSGHVHFLTVLLPDKIMCQDIAFRMFSHDINIMVSQVDWFNPVTGGINDYRNTSTICAAHSQHCHQAYG